MLILILAAGQGKRLNSSDANLPKVLRKVDNKPLIQYVLNQLDFLSKSKIAIIIGFLAEKVTDVCGDQYNYFLQEEQLGTGHAVMAAQRFYKNSMDDVLVLMGDMPFIKKETLLMLIEEHKIKGNDITLLSFNAVLPSSFGRIIRDSKGKVIRITEVKDASDEELKITEVNTGIAIYKSEVLDLLKEIKNNNAQKEYYLTDLIHKALEYNKKIECVLAEDPDEFLGINTRDDLEYAEKKLGGEDQWL